MKWRDQLALLLGTASPFGLAVNAGLAAEAASTDEGARADPPEIQKDLLVFRDPAERDRLLLFAGHRSHSSHSSHRSHSSHYSGSSGHSSHSSHYSSSGGYVTPAPVYTPPPAPKPRPIVRPPAPKPHPAPLKAWEDPGVPDLTEEEASAGTNTVVSRQRLTTGEVASMVTKVQVALVIRGYDPGPVDGKFGAKTKVALGRFQAANNLPISAAMDLETLRLLGVEIGMPSRTEVKPAAAPASATAGKMPTIINPDWAHRPTGEDMARYYPDRAQRMEVAGRATISCVVNARGALEACSIVSEDPADYGFGEAALKLSRLFRMKPTTLDGTPSDGGVITLPIIFQVPR